MYIAFEGIDGVGKTTQIELLKNYLKDDVVFTKEPGGVDIGVRDIVLNTKLSIKAQTMLFLADRAEHYKRVIEPNKDKIIITDRSYISGIAYALKWFDIDFLSSVNSFCMDGYKLDKVVFLKANQDTIKSRFANKSLDEIEKRGLDYFIQTQENIEKTLKTLGINTLTVNASDEINAIHEQIKSFLFK